MTTITLDDYNNSQIYTTLFPRMLPMTTNIQVYFDDLCQPVNPGGTARYSLIIMEYIWTYKKLMRTDDRVWLWYNRLFGKEGKGIRTAGEYASLQRKRKELKNKDKKTRAERIKRADKIIHDLKESIKYRYNNIILSEKYASVRNRYYLISDPLIKIICPKFLQDKNGAAYIKF